MTETGPDSPCLIVNADDYGYFRCTSKGILELASRGIVTATGVFANAISFTEQASWLRDVGRLDVGVHLNLTTGTPLTNDLAAKLDGSSGRFPGKFSMATAILLGNIKPRLVEIEWRAQIERCLDNGLVIAFLNSHEHIHMLPSLYRVATTVAKAYGIRHLRHPASQGSLSGTPASLFRGAVVKVLGSVNRRTMDAPAPEFLGMEASGRLDLAFLERSVPQLRPGRIYELMCHPGHFDPQEVRDPRLLHYHDWEGEFRALTDPATIELLHRHRVRLIGYRDVDVADDRLVVRQ